MQAMICIAMAYETVCSTARSAAAAAARVYIPHTFAEYEALIDRAAHAAYILAALAAAMPAPDPFNLKLAEAHDDLTGATDIFISDNKWNTVYTTGGAAAILAAQIAQQVKIDRGVAGLMKQCNFLLTDALCTSFNAAGMTAYQHLVNLDFVRLANSCESSFGRIPPADIRYPHLQCFGRLAHEFFSVGRLRGSSSANFFPIFNDPDLSAGLEAYKLRIDPFFNNLRNYKFATVEHAVDFLQATARVAFVHKASQDTSLPGPLRREMLACFQAYCTEQTTNAAYMTLARWNVLETAMRQRCAAAQVAMIFDAKVSYDKARSLQTPAAPAANIVTETTAIIALGKAIEALNKRQSATEAFNKAVPRAGFGRGRFEASCFWCGKKGHTLIDCDGPAPNPASKLARDEMIAAREKRDRDGRNADRKARRLSSAATSAVSDDEVGDDLDDFSQETFEKIQALFGQRDELTKS
jgi:hypothetical protein